MVSAGELWCPQCCICETHQNIKLLVNDIPRKMDYEELFLKSVCSTVQKDCMMNQCTEEQINKL